MNLLVSAIEASRNHLERVLGPAVFRPDRNEYLSSSAYNLIEGVKAEDFVKDLACAAGNELVSHDGKPEKFCAAHSSSALVVNSFGPFRNHPERLSWEEMGGFSRAWFEKKCRNGLRTHIPPHLDFLAERRC